MKLLFPLGYFYPSEYGGPSNSIYWMVKELCQLGFKPTIIATSTGIKGDKILFDVWHDTEFGKVMYCSDIKEKFPFLVIFRTFREIRNTDLIHLTSLFHSLSWSIAFLNLFYRKPIIWSVRGELFPTALSYGKWRKKIVLSFIRLVLLGKNIFFHSTSLTESKEIQNNFGKTNDIICLPNYIEIKGKFEQYPEKYLSYIGRIHPIKGLENLVDALSINVPFLSSDFIFKIAGNMEGDHYLKLKDKIIRRDLQNKIIFIGHLTGIEKIEFLSKSYFNFLTSYSENFGNVVLESLMLGTPVVASTGTPWGDLIKYNAGFYIENDVDSLDNVLNIVIGMQSGSYNIMRKNAYNYCISNYNIKNNIQNWIIQYNKLISGERKN